MHLKELAARLFNNYLRKQVLEKQNEKSFIRCVINRDYLLMSSIWNIFSQIRLSKSAWYK
jgi:hypothetical protein